MITGGGEPWSRYTGLVLTAEILHQMLWVEMFPPTTALQARQFSQCGEKKTSLFPPSPSPPCLVMQSTNRGGSKLGGEEGGGAR